MEKEQLHQINELDNQISRLRVVKEWIEDAKNKHLEYIRFYNCNTGNTDIDICKLEPTLQKEVSAFMISYLSQVIDIKLLQKTTDFQRIIVLFGDKSQQQNDK